MPSAIIIPVTVSPWPLFETRLLHSLGRSRCAEYHCLDRSSVEEKRLGIYKVVWKGTQEVTISSGGSFLSQNDDACSLMLQKMVRRWAFSIVFSGSLVVVVDEKKEDAEVRTQSRLRAAIGDHRPSYSTLNLERTQGTLNVEVYATPFPSLLVSFLDFLRFFAGR